MAGIPKIRDLEARKRALVTESEICRENLKADLHNLVLYGDGLRKRVDQVRRIGPWLTLGLPIAAPLLGLLSRRRNKHHESKHSNAKHPDSVPPSRVKASIATALMAWRLYRKYGPTVRSLVTHLVTKYRTRDEERSPAANI